MPKLTSRQTDTMNQLRRAHTNNPRVGDLREQAARATAPVESRTSTKGMLAEFIATVKQIPDGFYALPLASGADVNFFEVRTEGNRNWVYRLHGAPGDFRRERMSYQLMGFAAKHILGSGGGRDAAILFGKKTNVCGRCNSPLTKQVSRDLGLGPVCKKVYGL
jgi:hypothetical protein